MPRPSALAVGDLELDPATHRVLRGGVDVDLSPKEFALLELFLRHPDEVLTRTAILEHAWDFAYDGTSNVVDVYVRYLREKIDRPFDRQTIETVRGVGYRLRARRDPMKLRPRTLRGRLTLIFALVTIVLSGLVGLLVDVQYRSALNSALDEALQTRFLAAAQELRSTSTGSTVKPVIPDAESFAQVIDAHGDVVAASPRALRHRPVITGADLSRAHDHQVTLVRDAGHEANVHGCGRVRSVIPVTSSSWAPRWRRRRGPSIAWSWRWRSASRCSPSS